MARTTHQIARILSELYDETYSNQYYEPFRITWANLRGIAGVSKLTPISLRKINYFLNESECTLNPMDNFLVVIKEKDLTHLRLVPPRIVEEYLYDKGEDIDEDEDEDEDEDIEVTDHENCEIDDEDVEE